MIVGPYIVTAVANSCEPNTEAHCITHNEDPEPQRFKHPWPFVSKGANMNTTEPWHSGVCEREKVLQHTRSQAPAAAQEC